MSLSREFRGTGKRRQSTVRAYAIHALRQMQRRDKMEIDTQKALADMGTKDLKFGRLALSIPEDHYQILKIIHPELSARDGKEKLDFVKNRVPKLELFKPYLINEKEQLRGNRHGG